jgi:pimeloyl-ACP methyl ester carboxylesterase
MGANLDSNRDDDWDRVWVHYWRLLKGRIVDLELSESGLSIPGRPPVRVMGQFADYVPLVVELQKRWQVLPFAFDWRVDIDDSADRLAEAIRDFGAGQPLHLVAHSMGGLVARRFAHRYPELWAGIDDPEGHARGGRLIQLGTPNRGSFAISLVLTGEEPVIRKLALLDQAHSKRKLVALLRGFTGSYQMLPAPDASIPDDRLRLYDAAAWGAWPVVQALIDRGRAFQEAMGEVRDPERIVYVAGYDRETPDRIRIGKPGEFEYRVTQDGDGRVPHDLGLLPGVRTFYVKEAHGDLPKNTRVLGCIHELLQRGETAALDSALQKRARTRDEPAVWKPAAELLKAESVLDPIPAPSTRGGELAAKESEAIAASVLRGFVGHARPVTRAGTARSAQERKRRIPRVGVRVVHADITRVDADLYSVGHYAGVMPQYAEKALDLAISADPERGVLARETRTGLLSGELGNVQLYPWHGRADRLLAVAGMGRPGTFHVAELRRLGQCLTSRALHLSKVRRLATVLIGSGEGNLRIPEAVRTLFAGAADALRQHEGRARLREVWLVERDERKAVETLAALQALAAEPGFRACLDLAVEPRVVPGRGGRSARQALDDEFKAWQRRMRAGKPSPDDPITRMTWMRDDEGMRVAALTSTVVVPERSIPLDLSLHDELVERMTDPETERAAEDSVLLGRLVVPHDFRPHLAGVSRLVIEVDRYMAGIHWEMLALPDGTGVDAEPLSVARPLARQLRTEYAPAPMLDVQEDRPLRVLIVGDPGDPKTGWDLEGARKEAMCVLAAMRKLQEAGQRLDVTALIGAPTARRTGPLEDLPAAGRLDVLAQLMRQRWDVLHYCGHGDFDAQHPGRAGWMFEDGKLLSANELRRADFMPRLVVANACLSARTSDWLQRGRRSSDLRSEADLVPSLADEFFRRGVRNYVGTAWEVDDEGAVVFAECFYDQLLAQRASIGEALRVARKRLYDLRSRYDALWAAYQHYGNPDDRLAAGEPGDP